MESIDFKSLSERLRTELSRVYFWQKIVRILSIIVYLFVFCWMMFVLFGGYLVGYIGLENYSVVTQYIFPVFMGFIVLNFAFSRSLMKFQGQENDIMRSIMSAMFPSVLFSFSSQLDQRILSGSKLFNSSFPIRHWRLPPMLIWKCREGIVPLYSRYRGFLWADE